MLGKNHPIHTKLVARYILKGLISTIALCSHIQHLHLLFSLFWHFVFMTARSAGRASSAEYATTAKANILRGVTSTIRNSMRSCCPIMNKRAMTTIGCHQVLNSASVVVRESTPPTEPSKASMAEKEIRLSAALRTHWRV